MAPWPRGPERGARPMMCRRVRRVGRRLRALARLDNPRDSRLAPWPALFAAAPGWPTSCAPSHISRASTVSLAKAISRAGRCVSFRCPPGPCQGGPAGICRWHAARGDPAACSWRPQLHRTVLSMQAVAGVAGRPALSRLLVLQPPPLLLVQIWQAPPRTPRAASCWPPAPPTAAAAMAHSAHARLASTARARMV